MFSSILCLVSDDDTTVVLPTDDLDLGPVEFPVTTDYHWSKFDVNATTNGAHEVVQGPFQFGLADKLDKNQEEVTIYLLSFRLRMCCSLLGPAFYCPDIYKIVAQSLQNYC